MKVKVLELTGADFLAITNVSRRNAESGSPEWISGLGDSIDDAVNDLLTRFVADVRENSQSTKVTDADFEWSAHEDF